MDLYSPVNILLVDDTPANIFSLESLLLKEGRNFFTATSGKQALKIVLENNIDLIILDVQMANMDGFEVAQILKLNNKTKDIPVIFATAEKKEHTSVMKGFEGGALDYLSKPLDPEITKAKVSILLQLQVQKRELLQKNSSLEKFALLINNSSDIIGIIDARSLIIEEINKAFTTTLGFTEDEAKGSTLISFLDDEAKRLLESIVKSQEKQFSFEIPILSKSGEKKWLQWRVLVKDNKWFVNGRDITQQKIADEKIKDLNVTLQENLLQLEETNKELESFSYSISHDLRAPIRSLIGYSKILEEDHIEKLDDEAKRLLEIIHRNSQKMGNLIDDLLEFSRLGRKELKKSEICMDTLVEGVIADCGISVNDKIEIIKEKLLPAKGDYSLITQVWINLISNAVKYSSKKEHAIVTIGNIQSQDGSIIYFVKDNGVGFNQDYTHKLFGVFQRLHSSKDFEGTGIGLAIVHRVITRHGGRVWAEAKAGEGASFFFSLPG